ncbi:tetratricopeptide repeat-containing sulfotransferase family protein [Alteraurantiacibacter aquimixticola]|uniref:Sulfotransferase family protein n=1 Tax=Alteraurantiacibacter aquimixticola TaxID=2489173 RepID=A0A4T3F0W2_9SPHN|nr:tetratricopeptide repeat-containing sulfotransferase family protein [Alteraurantiacibacter aquimixticola]TIX49832.1 sulfotransferase family protein [Alteraurantiacibacter aquimixticola]
MNTAGPTAELSPATLEAQARQALEEGDLLAATNAAKSLVMQQRDAPQGYFLLGIAAEQAGQIDNAVLLLEAAAQRGPEAEHLAQLARLLSLLHRDGEAANVARKALVLDPSDARTLDTIGCVLTRIGDHEGAIAPFTSAVAIEPDNLDFRYNLAAAASFTGQVEAARENYEAILSTDPGNARAHYALAILSRQTAAANHVPRLRQVLTEASDPDDALRIRYALAKELEDLGDAEAFEHLSTANAQHKRALQYDFADDAAIFDAIEALFAGRDGKLFAGEGNPDGSPIFVTGMPRTGTTLVDRILSSHHHVASAGELQAMPVAVKRLAGTPSRKVIDAETVQASGDIEPQRIGEAYMAQAAPHRPSEGSRFIDKLPANFLYIGHIARALPNARIVCLRRNPLDTVWSNYKNLFASQSAYYAYSYDLMDTARYYARFARLMALWDRLFPGRVLQLSYEELVADQESQTRRLLDHCGLDWDEACLNFHESKAAVATPSAAQVRRPLNADAVGRWRAHEKTLAPICDWFEEQGIPTG